ncbi:hypothetical protein [Streptomyces sp. LUP30]|uniref:hypothetical protein n=1 Tax=Streptomyces sp. LUP30 TaxID=1890285 RepID=UPI000851A6B4|nr:hypothetical protein [Streptomyces sp. LUP30]
MTDLNVAEKTVSDIDHIRVSGTGGWIRITGAQEPVLYVLCSSSASMLVEASAERAPQEAGRGGHVREEQLPLLRGRVLQDRTEENQEFGLGHAAASALTDLGPLLSGDVVGHQGQEVLFLVVHVSDGVPVEFAQGSGEEQGRSSPPLAGRARPLGRKVRWYDAPDVVRTPGFTGARTITSHVRTTVCRLRTWRTATRTGAAATTAPSASVSASHQLAVPE